MAGSTWQGWQALSSGADPRLITAVLEVASLPGMGLTRVRRVLAEQLDAGADGDVAALLRALRAPEQLPMGQDRAARRAAQSLRALDASVAVVSQPGYPSRLAQAWPELGAPAWLFVASPDGRLPDGPAVAIVGTRQPSLDGLRTARELGRMLAAAGVCVVSGLARGIDQATHKGALEADGASVAVLGTGFGVDYPRGTARLRAALRAAGGLVTELLPGQPPRPHHFLERNRIVSGLCDVTVVVEGRARSGALQTARLAAAQGREVMAVPGSLHAPTARAPLDLIRDGARPVTCLEDVLEAVAGLPSPAVASPEPVRARPAGLDELDGQLLDLLGPEPAAVDELVHATGAPVGAVLSAVSRLTERGLVERTGRGLVAS
ncbi:MAG: DNA-processing protein DprA [Egibacteraceae bacterium]